MISIKKIFSSFAVLIVVSGCAANNPKITKFNTKMGEVDIKIGYEQYLGKGYYSILEKVDDKWTIYEVSKDRVYDRPHSESEVIFVSENLNYAQVFYYDARNYEGNNFECSPLVDNENLYTPCTSALTDTIMGLSIGKNIIAAVTTLGLASGYHARVDFDKVAEAIEESDLISFIDFNRDYIDLKHNIKTERAKRQMLEADQARLEQQKQYLTSRLKALPFVKQIGVQVCSLKNSNIGQIKYFGYVENIVENVDNFSGSRIQIRVTNAHVIPSTLQPGGFQTHIIWDDPVYWDRC